MFNLNLKKMSKFVKELLERLSEEKNTDKLAEKAFNKANAKVGSQIASLKCKRLELEDKLDDANEKLGNATFCENFDLVAYDYAKLSVVAIDDEIADIDKTIEARNALLEGWK